MRLKNILGFIYIPTHQLPNNHWKIYWFGLLLMLASIILPMPGKWLDTLIIISITSSILIVLACVFYKQETGFIHVFEIASLIVIYKIGVGFAITLIFLESGHEQSSSILTAIYEFLSLRNNGSYAIGVIQISAIFLALLYLNSATKIAESCVRFALDDMPALKIAIDRSVSNRSFDEQEDIVQRSQIRDIMDNYTKLDKLAKFIQFDIRINILLAVVNIFGGLIVYFIFHGEDIRYAFAVSIKQTVVFGIFTLISTLLFLGFSNFLLIHMQRIVRKKKEILVQFVLSIKN